MAFANDKVLISYFQKKKIFFFFWILKGVGVYDLRARRLVGFEETGGQNG